MRLITTAFKICFPPSGVKAVARDIVRTLDGAMASSVVSEVVAAPMAAPAYVECRIQHSTEDSVDGCTFHSRSENMPQWLRIQRFATTWNRRSEGAKE